MKKKFYYNPGGFYDVAEKIKDDKSYKSEDRCRTAIGRYYYFIFLTIRDLILNVDKRPLIHDLLNSPRSHSYLRTYLEELSDITGNLDFDKLSKKIKKLHYLRKLADYNTEMRITYQNADKAKKLADEIIGELNSITYDNKKGLKDILEYLAIKEMDRKVSKKEDKKYLPDFELG